MRQESEKQSGTKSNAPKQGEHHQQAPSARDNSTQLTRGGGRRGGRRREGTAEEEGYGKIKITPRGAQKTHALQAAWTAKNRRRIHMRQPPPRRPEQGAQKQRYRTREHTGPTRGRRTGSTDGGRQGRHQRQGTTPVCARGITRSRQNAARSVVSSI